MLEVEFVCRAGRLCAQRAGAATDSRVLDEVDTPDVHFLRLTGVAKGS